MGDRGKQQEIVRMFQSPKLHFAMQKTKPKNLSQRMLDRMLKLSYIFSLIPAVFLIPSAVFVVLTMPLYSPQPPTPMQGVTATPHYYRTLSTKFLLIAMLFFVISVSFLLVYLLLLECRKKSKSKVKHTILEPIGSTVVRCPKCDAQLDLKLGIEKGVVVDENQNIKPLYILCQP